MLSLICTVIAQPYSLSIARWSYVCYICLSKMVSFQEVLCKMFVCCSLTIQYSSHIPTEYTRPVYSLYIYTTSAIDLPTVLNVRMYVRITHTHTDYTGPGVHMMAEAELRAPSKRGHYLLSATHTHTRVGPVHTYYQGSTHHRPHTHIPDSPPAHIGVLYLLHDGLVPP